MNQMRKRPECEAGDGNTAWNILAGQKYSSTPHHVSPFPISKIQSALKAGIVFLALRGLLPIKAAEWLIQRGGLRHA
jgi:hypothetical protein